MHESIVLSFLPPTHTAHTVAIPLHDWWPIYDPSSTSLVYAIHYTILVITISCKGQALIRQDGARSLASRGEATVATEHCFPERHRKFFWPIQEILSLVCVCARINHPFITPPISVAHTTALLLHDFFAIYDPPQTLPLYAIHHTILVMTISCKG